MELAGWELPLFSSDLEPHELKRLRCSVCSDAWAEVQCHPCNQQYCAGCEAQAHSAVGNPATHQDESEPCNVCQDCQVKGSDFFCRDCERYQCELCCSAVHSSASDMRAHHWIVTEGTPSSLLNHSTWDAHFIKYAKMVRRQQQHQPQEVVKLEPGALSDYVAMTPAVDDDDDATSEEGEQRSDTNADHAAESAPTVEPVVVKTERQTDEPTSAADTAVAVADEAMADESVEVKMERVQLHDQANAENAVSAAETPQPPPPLPLVGDPPIKTEPVRQPPPHTAKPRGTRHDVVDLTGDDDDDEDENGHASESTSHVKPEPVATASAPFTASSFDASFADDEDLLRSAMIREYNTHNQQVAETEQQRAVLSKRAVSGSVDDMLTCKQQLDQLKKTFVDVAQNRNAAVARLLYYLYGDAPDDFAQKVQGAVAADIPDAQAAYHRRLHDLQTAIDAQRDDLMAAKRHMDEAVAMKSGSDMFAEVMRLSTEISTKEQQLHALETQRLDGFLQLAHVSAAVRSAALALVVAATTKANAS